MDTCFFSFKVLTSLFRNIGGSWLMKLTSTKCFKIKHNECNFRFFRNISVWNMANFWNFSLKINPQIRRSDISRYIHIYSNKCKYKICALANAQCVCTFKVSTYVCTCTNRTFCGDFKCKFYFNLTIFLQPAYNKVTISWYAKLLVLTSQGRVF